MELLIDFVFTWVVVLVPPALLRAVRRAPWSKGWAIGFATILFFANHVFFVALTGVQSSRGYLIIGAWLSFLVLRWQTRASAVEAVAQQRRELGYGDDERPVKPMRPASATADQADDSTFRGDVSDSTSSPKPTAANPTAHTQRQALKWKRGLFRLWLVLAPVWMAAIVIQAWPDVRYSTRYFLYSDEMLDDALQERTSEINRLRRTLANLGELKEAASLELAQPNIRKTTLERLLDESRKDLIALRPAELQARIDVLEATPASIADPDLRWIGAMLVPPIVVPVLALLLALLVRWLYRGFWG